MNRQKKKLELISHQALEEEKLREMRERTPKERLLYLFKLREQCWNKQAPDPDEDEQDSIILRPKA